MGSGPVGAISIMERGGDTVSVPRIAGLGVLSSLLFALGDYMRLTSKDYAVCSRPSLLYQAIHGSHTRFVSASRHAIGAFLIALAVLGFAIALGDLVVYVSKAIKSIS
jgi:hypothetical protein